MRQFKQIKCIIFILGFFLSHMAQAVVCTGIMNHDFGNFPVKYILDDVQESTGVGSVRCWAEARGAWTEGNYRWTFDEGRGLTLLTMAFGQETNICFSYRTNDYICRSNLSPMEWEIRCDQPGPPAAMFQ